MSIPLFPADAWQEMRLHMDWNERFSLCILFSDSHAALATMRQWVDDTWQCRTAPLTKLEPLEAANAPLEVLQGIESHVKKLSAVRAPVWVQMLAQDGYQKNDWNQARATLLARLNESREWLINGFARPLILCFPADWQQRTPQIAPDLWHVRSFTALLKAPAPVKVLVDGGFNGGAVLNESINIARSAAPFRDINDAIQSTIVPLQQAVATARARLAKSPETFNLQRELSVALNKLGDGWMEVSQPAEALRAYRECLEIFRQLRKALGDSPQVLRDLSVSLIKVGEAELEAGRNESVLVAYRESSEITRQLRKTLGDNPQVLRDLLASLIKIGEAESDAGRNEAALVAYHEGLKIARQLRKALGDDPQVLRDLLVSLIKVGNAESDVGRNEAALVAHRESLELARQLHQILGDSPEVLRGLAASLSFVGNTESNAGRNQAALLAYRECLEICCQLREALGDSPQVLRDLSVSLEKVGNAESDAGRNEAALVAYRESLELRRQLREALGDSPQVLGDLAALLERLARLDSVEIALRKAYLHEAMALRQQLVAALPDSDFYRKRLDNLAILQSKLGGME